MLARTTLTRSLRACAVVIAVGAALAAPAAALADPVTPQTTPDSEIAAVNPSLLEFWNETFQAWGKTYQPAGAVYYYDYVDRDGNTVTASCGGNQIEPGVYGEYCPADNNVYIDYNQNLDQMNQIGSYEAGALFAHEIGHNVQQQMGIPFEQPYDELQADCFSGMYTRWAVDRGDLTTDDAQQGVDWAYSAGGGGDTGKDMSHGTQYDRGFAWMQGYLQASTSGNEFDSTACNNVGPLSADQQMSGDPNYLFPVAADTQTSSSSTTDTSGTTDTSSTTDGTVTTDSAGTINQLLAMNTPTSIDLAKMLSDSAAHNASVWLAPACDSSYNGCL